MQLKWHKVGQSRCVATCESCIESAKKNLAVQTKPNNHVYRMKPKITDVLSKVRQARGTASSHGEEVCRDSIWMERHRFITCAKHANHMTNPTIASSW
jgi:hypothetical protein